MSATRNLWSRDKLKVIYTTEVYLDGLMLKWKDGAIFTNNISALSISALPAPPFPRPIILLFLAVAGFSYFDNAKMMGFSFFCAFVGVIWFFCWIVEKKDTKREKYLNIVTNSGYTYAFHFWNGSGEFVTQVLDCLTAVFSNGVISSTKYHVDFQNRTIS